MTKSVSKLKKASIGTLGVLMAGTLFASQLVSFVGIGGKTRELSTDGNSELISEINGTVKDDITSQFNSSVVQSLPSGLDSGREISVIVNTVDEGLLSAFNAQSGISRYATVADFSTSAQGQKISGRIDAANNAAKTLAEKSGVKFEYGASYETFFGGFEVVLKAGDYNKFASALAGTGVSVSISEEYAPSEAQLVTNDVNVYETGIFDSSDSPYDGTGTVIAVLDTGLDYTHSVFDPDLFDVAEEDLKMTTASLSSVVSGLRAAEYTNGLSVADVYLNNKVPYAYDYADRDPDVYPLESEHGTHVAGVIVGDNRGSKLNGKDDPEIVGVAPKAQLVMMKTFSDISSGAKWSWIVAALEDCVRLNVDVINMSLGTAAGFSEDKDEESEAIYAQIAESGISLVCAASNDYNSTFGSEKNGNLGLTTNPDSATVGSPSTYTSSLSVASISGVKTPYLLYNNSIMYFTESANAASEPKSFVDDILPDGVESMTYEYVTVPGVGLRSNYTGIDVKGKIALVRRGNNTFEEKARIAASLGAAGVIVYNNVSGDITMTVGTVDIAVCSISRDNGEILASHESGTITISRKQVAGPFMSNFSSWGPTPDLRIKPEISAHGGDILSSVPGQAYDRMSGTSMASPNQAGVTALVRQYVNEKFPEKSASDKLSLVYNLMMSTTDIALNVNGLPYSVRKQGSGLANLTKATSTLAYISTYERSDDLDSPNRFTEEHNGKAKIEYGDDKNKTGVYTLVFDINNISSAPLSYDVNAIVMTEGVSEQRTVRGDYTVTEEGYLLEGASVTVDSVEGGTHTGNVVTVSGKDSAKVTVTIRLSDSDKQYLDQTAENGRSIFANGMYVEGYITLKATDGSTVDLNVPYLAFYGDWTQAPIFDIDYFETEKDELNDAIDPDQKTMADAWATAPVGQISDNYLYYLGSYAFVQPSGSTKISADRKHIALSNDSSSLNSIYAIWAGMLRGAKTVHTTITDSTTGEVIWEKTDTNQRKSYNYGSMIIYSSIDIGFNVAEYDLKNNTQYMVRVEASLDYPGEQNNTNSVFEFPFVTDFQAPIVSDVQFYTEYDKTAQKNKLFARASIYDNHYAMGYRAGVIVNEGTEANPSYALKAFKDTFTQIYSDFNTTSEVTIELTDYLDKMKNDAAHKDTFTIAVYDYALNGNLFEIRIPDEVRYLYFADGADGEQFTEITLNPNETYSLTNVAHVYPTTSWVETLQFVPEDTSVVAVLNGKALALAEGKTTTINVYDAKAVVRSDGTVSGGTKLGELTVHVRAPGDDGYVRYDAPTVELFRVNGYTATKAFYDMSYQNRDIGVQGDFTSFSANAVTYYVSMFPSEQITLDYVLESYFDAEVQFKSSNENVVRVDGKGTVTALDEGSASVTINVYVDGKSTAYSRTLMVTVKDPYTRSGPYLMSYHGGGVNSYVDADGVVHERASVTIPANLAFTQIYSFAFTNYDYIPKSEAEGDVINDEDPGTTKQWYLGENQDIYEVIIPEGVEVIGAYAFAGMRNLQRVVLPSTVTKINQGAFMGCTSLTDINLENVKFINQSAFAPGPVRDADYNILYYESVPLSNVGRNQFASIIAIGNYAFYNTDISVVTLTESAQSIGAYAFANTSLHQITISAERVKLSEYAFANCYMLSRINVNAYAIPDGVFEGCDLLENVTLGRDVETIGINAFRGTGVKSFTVEAGNPNFEAQNSGAVLVSKDGKTLVYVAPEATSVSNATVTAVGANAFSGNYKIRTVNLPNVTSIGDYAFYGAANLSSFTFSPNLTAVGRYAFAGEVTVTDDAIYSTAPQVQSFDAFGKLTYIADHAFEGSTTLTTVNIPDGATVGEGAFASMLRPESITIGNNVTLGAHAFEALAFATFTNYMYTNVFVYAIFNSSGEALTHLSIGNNVTIGEYAFAGHGSLETVTLGTSNVSIGDYAFYNCGSLNTVENLNLVKHIGAYAFSGMLIPVYFQEVDDNGNLVGDLSYIGEIGAQAANLTSLDLSGLVDEYNDAGELVNPGLGEGAFAYNFALTDVKLGENLTVIPNYAFYGAPIDEINLDYVTEIGESVFGNFQYVTFTDVIEYAYIGPVFTELDLHNVNEIGAYAFEGATELTKVEFKKGVIIGDYAFAEAEMLADVNLENVVFFGAYSFAYTAISGAVDLSAAEVIDDHAFMGTYLTKVTLGENLVEVGENPFAFCPLEPFASTTWDTFNGHVVEGSEKTIYTFSLNDTFKIIDGALYRKMYGLGALRETQEDGSKVFYGYELITYPGASEKAEFVVADGTIRITAYAFAGNTALMSVTLSEQLKAIGDKAFYGCDALKLVVFQSLQAPILEEQYNWRLIYPVYNEETGIYESNIPGPTAERIYAEYYGEYTTLNILKYDLWGLSYSSLFYGANFKDYIGHTDGEIIMVRPKNGKNYDSFIFGQYFDTVHDGAVVAEQATLNAIWAIEDLPDTADISEFYRAQIEAARALYNLIVSNDQKALVYNYNDLVTAEEILATISSNGGSGTEEPPVENDPVKDNTAVVITLAVLTGVFGLAAIAGFTLLFLTKKKMGQSETIAADGENNAEDAETEDDSEKEDE